ncbi:MAG: hypothetical protein COB93_10605 [Sneathiella sp.]|nr:MAG: hypothetical protein COB93_10605 [Sneathiella sp.]
MAKETDLYAPIKDLLEARGYEVKAEVNGCDVVAVKDNEAVVIVELKLTFSLDLVLQGISRQNMTNDVYLAVAAPGTPLKRKNWRARQRNYIKLCRMLGLGMILVNTAPKNGRKTDVLLDPGPYAPKRNKRRQTRLMTEFLARVGDPNTGGINRTKIITAYRQDAFRCAVVMSNEIEMNVADIRTVAGVDNAASILQKNHYDWFERTRRGVYCLTPQGRESVQSNTDILPSELEKMP